jgi:hypothetical protein
MLTGMILSFGYVMLRQVLQLLAQGMRSERANDVEILVLLKGTSSALQL